MPMQDVDNWKETGREPSPSTDTEETDTGLHSFRVAGLAGVAGATVQPASGNQLRSTAKQVSAVPQSTSLPIAWLRVTVVPAGC